MDRNISIGVGGFFLGLFLVAIGIWTMINISPYKDCSLLQIIEDPFCENQLKNQFELSLEYAGSIFWIVIGSFIIIITVFALVKMKSGKF